jgi:hypothetical protein
MASDLTGQRFTKLTAKEYVPHKGRLKWRCICDCGKETFVLRRNLLQNHTRSCGCLLLESAAKRAISGRSHELEYATWRTLKSSAKGLRANSGGPCYIDPRWEESYEAFFDDMGPRPSKRHRFCRKVTSAGFFKENCYWGTSRYAHPSEGNS